MNLKPYPKYKDSGIEWLGKVPEEWKVLKLKWIAHLEYGNSLSEEAREDGTVPVYGSNGIVGKHSKSITGKPAIIIGRKGSYGKVSYSDVPCFPIDTTYYIDQSLSKENIRWLYYILSAIELDQITFDTGVPGLSRAFAYAKSVPLPPIEHQTAIANFLDHKTAKIDELIEKNERLIELLKEKRQAIISHAVTKRLDPNAKMKDSGIGWIGEIPEGWEVSTLKRFAEKITDGSHYSPETQEEGFPYITVQDIKGDKIDFDNCKRISEKEYLFLKRNDCQPKKYDVLLTKDGTIGKAVIVKENKDFVILSSLGLITPNQLRITSDYLRYYLISGINLDQMFSFIQGSALTRLTIKLINKLLVICPPLHEQQSIVEYLNQKTSNIDKAIPKILSQIEKLKEYRQALISNVVTGKVRIA